MLLAKTQQPNQMPEVPVNGDVLKWARDVRGLDIEDAAKLLEVSTDELLEYETGGKKPLVGFLRKMSKEYQINFTSLLMPAPLPIPKRPTDHRIRYGRRSLSMNTLVAMEEVAEALETFDDIAAESKEIIPRLSIGTADLGDDPEVVASRERKRFGVSVEEQRNWRSLAAARRQWRKRIENRGVFTYMIAMPREELSGFSMLRDEKLAAICVNDNELTEGAKVFTLMHEYCHLLLRRTGISDENNRNLVERFCNEFAASFLIPIAPLREAVSYAPEIPYEFSGSEVKKLATRFRVSNSCMALRLDRTKLAPSGFYGRRTGPWDIPAETRPLGPGQHPSQITIRIKRIGRLHASTALTAAETKTISDFDAADLIGLRLASLPKVKKALE